jgi:hypothetical protein
MLDALGLNRPIKENVIRSDVLDLESDDITNSQLAVDG